MTPNASVCKYKQACKVNRYFKSSGKPTLKSRLQ